MYVCLARPTMRSGVFIAIVGKAHRTGQLVVEQIGWLARAMMMMIAHCTTMMHHPAKLFINRNATPINLKGNVVITVAHLQMLLQEKRIKQVNEKDFK